MTVKDGRILQILTLGVKHILSKPWPSYARLMRMDKPIGSLLLLWPSLWGLWFANDGRPAPHLLLIFIAGVFLMRSAGCVINDVMDRKIDSHVPRTKYRPLPQGEVPIHEAIILAGGLVGFAFGLVLLTNRMTICLSVIGLFLAIIYPFMKRFIHLPQAILGLAFSWGIPMAYAASLERLPWTAWFLFFIGAVWTMIYDTEYAMADRKDDIKLGLKSSVIWFGDHDKLIIAVLQGGMILLLALFGLLTHRNVWYGGGVFGVMILFCHQQYLICHREPVQCIRAFQNNHHVGWVIFAGIFLSYL